jgi:hypothetical protein
MKRLILAILCAVLLIASGCSLGAAKTVTQTVGTTTKTEYLTTAVITSTIMATSVITQPAVTNTVTSPPLTSTVTSPPVTSTVIQPMVTTVTSPPVTNTVTSPPVTTTVTTSPVTTTVTYIPPVTKTAAEAIAVSITPIGGGVGIEPLNPSVLVNKYYLILSYDNTVDKQYTNVSFKLLFITTSGLTLTTPYIQVVTATGAMPLWIPSGAIANPYTFQSYSGITIAPNAKGSMILEITIISTGTGFLYPQVSIN